MSATEYTAPAVCAMLMAGTLWAVTVDRVPVSADSALPVPARLTNADPAGSSAGVTAAEASLQRLQISAVPPGSQLIISSLDLTAAAHQITVEWRPQACNQLVPGYVDADQTGTVCRIRQPYRCSNLTSTSDKPQAVAHPPTSGQEVFSVSAISDTRQKLPALLNTAAAAGPQTAAVGASLRPVCIPQFAAGPVCEKVTTAVLVQRGSRVQVYADPEPQAGHSETADQQLAAAIIDCCESRLLPLLLQHDLPVQDIDGDNLLTVVISQLQQPAGLSAHAERQSQPPILACVRRGDFTNDRDFGGDIVYVDRRLADQNMLAPVLMHELAHAATYSELTRLQAEQSAAAGDTREIPNWLNEAIAHVFERRVDPASPNLRQRLQDFRNAPYRYPLIVPDQLQYSADGRGGCRAAGALFLEHTLNGLNSRSAAAAMLAYRGSAVERLEAVSGRSFAEMFRDWTLTLAAVQQPGQTSPQHVAQVAARACADFDPASRIFKLPDSARGDSDSNGTGTCVGFQALRLPANRSQIVLVRGTAAIWFQPTVREGSLLITAPTASKIQLTVVSPLTEANRSLAVTAPQADLGYERLP